MRRVGLLATVLLCLAAAPTAAAGGDRVVAVATAGRVWVADEGRVLELDAATGRLFHAVRVRHPSVTALVASDGAVWAGSVENGLVPSAVTRIPFDAAHGRTVLDLPTRLLYELASDGRSVWVLTGPRSPQRLTRIDVATGASRTTAVAGTLGLLGADPTGGTPGLFAVETPGVLARYDRQGHPRRLAHIAATAAAPAVAAGSVWVPGRSSLTRVDAQTGRIRGRLEDPGASALAVTAANGSVWLLELRGDRTAILAVDPERMRIVARRPLPGTGSAELVYGSGSLWLAESTPVRRLWRLDPRTLRRTLVRRLP